MRTFATFFFAGLNCEQKKKRDKETENFKKRSKNSRLFFSSLSLSYHTTHTTISYTMTMIHTQTDNKGVLEPTGFLLTK